MNLIEFTQYVFEAVPVRVVQQSVHLFSVFLLYMFISSGKVLNPRNDTIVQLEPGISVCT